MKRMSIALGITILMGCSAALVQNTATKPEQRSTDWLRGGALYDKWWKTMDAPAPTGDHPLWASRPDTTTNQRSGATTWRCKECHGWDYKGVDGVYGSNSHKTGFPGILQAKDKGDAELFELIANNHGYRDAGLTDNDIWDLVSFVQKGLVDNALFIDDKNHFIDSSKNGEHVYLTGAGTLSGCSDCHGNDGLDPITEGFNDFPGHVGKKNPWELLHKIRFGQPGTGMPAYGEVLPEDSLRALGAHIQTLPSKPQP